MTDTLEDAEEAPFVSEAYIPISERVAAFADEALRMAALGLTVDQIADRMCVSAETVAALLAFTTQAA